MDMIVKLLEMLFGSGKTKQIVINIIKDQLLKKDGGLPALIEQLQKNGLGDAVASWVSTGKNKTVSPAQIADGLGADKLSALAAEAGLPVDTFKKQLAKLLPQVVDQMTPAGQVPG